jgi:hypothetical protein
MYGTWLGSSGAKQAPAGSVGARGWQLLQGGSGRILPADHDRSPILLLGGQQE